MDLAFLIEKMAGKKSVGEFEEKLLLNSNKTFQEFVEKNFFCGIIFGFAAIFLAVWLKFAFTIIAVGFFAGFFLPFVAGFFYQNYLFEKNRSDKEKFVPDALLIAGSFPNGTPLETIFSNLSKDNCGKLSLEFEKALLEIRKGSTVENALNSLKKRNKSKIIDRAMNLFIQGYNSGAELSQIFRETAEDILETNSILRERASAMVVEKYTLLVAGAVVVPLILGLLVGMVSKMDFNLFSESFGLSVQQRKSILEAALFSNQVYLVEYAFLASVFAAFQENDKKKAMVYAAILVPLSLIVYNLAKAQ